MFPDLGKLMSNLEKLDAMNLDEQLNEFVATVNRIEHALNVQNQLVALQLWLMHPKLESSLMFDSPLWEVVGQLLDD